jgi:peptide deformylase
VSIHSELIVSLHKLTLTVSRVVQHEIDHLNGVLIIDHGPAIISMEANQHG